MMLSVIPPVVDAAFLADHPHAVVADVRWYLPPITVDSEYYSPLEVAWMGHRWLTPAEMLDGLALAESTPGPTILVIQHIGFLAAWKDPGTLTPLAAATLGAALSTYVTFLPSFLFILAGGPYVEAIARSRLAAGALAGIGAAVVGVILNLALFLGVPVIWPAGGPDPVAIVVAAAALWLLLARGLAVHWAVLAGAAAGLVEAALRGAF
jgi:chromate transporter